MASAACVAVDASAQSTSTPQKESAPAAVCANGAKQPGIAKARAVLNANPQDLPARFALASAWSELGCYSDASQVLQEGLALHPRSTELQSRAKVAKSMISEQNYFDSLDTAARGARLSRASFRCTRLADLSACEDALTLNPSDANLLLGEADALVQLRRPGEAIGVYRRAAARSPAVASAAAVKIAQAESHRLAFLSACESQDSPAALQACDAAWLPGSPDELRLFKRRAVLLQVNHQPAGALQAYMSAARLKPADKATALGIVTLTEAMPDADALTLAARGAALMTLGRPAEAKRPLRAALRLAPSMAEARQQLREAESAAPLVREEVDKPKPVVMAKAMPEPVAAVPAARLYSNEAPVGRTN